ncbi:acyltransferase family protein [Kitasatospora sp. NPDC058063]|uniref:acyltransferase family protein n=1 Tax=unclassified Kitasatospora TaxID=2633591 RepID=UPI0036DF8353
MKLAKPGSAPKPPPEPSKSPKPPKPPTPTRSSKPPGSPGSPASARLGWLDALRGIAALAVAMHHFGLLGKIPHAGGVPRHLDLGFFGVMLFFLVSGYIIPASLERRGDVRAFWTGRLFRIYPAVAVTVLASLLVLPRSGQIVQSFPFDHPVLSLAANGLLLQDLLGVPSTIGVMWSLTYEMVFYYFVCALFVRGWHRHSAPIAVGFASVALVLGTWLPIGGISVDLAATRHLVAAAGIVVLMAAACIATARPDLTRWGALLLGGLGLVLITVNNRTTGFETMLIFATMFAGTVLYRLEHGLLDRLPALLCCGFVIVTGVTVGYLYNRDTALWHTWTPSWESFSSAYLAAWALFAAAMLLRRRRFPRWLCGLGTISFSVYLLHGPLMYFLGWKLRDYPPIVGPKGQAALTLGYLGAVVVLSWLSYRLVEIPFQNLGRRAVRALDRRFPAPAPAPPAAAAPGPRVPEPEPAAGV